MIFCGLFLVGMIRIGQITKKQSQINDTNKVDKIRSLEKIDIAHTLGPIK